MGSKEDSFMLGSTTAKGGFKNEREIVDKFNKWQNDPDAQKWLVIMGYVLKEIERVIAVQVHGYKTDVQVQITIITKKFVNVENLSVKLVSNPQGFNQVDKRWVDKYVEMWNIPSDVTEILKLHTGETKPTAMSLRDRRKMFFDEMSEEAQRKLIDFFTANKVLVVADIIKGRGELSAGWMLVIMKAGANSRWVLKSINHAMQIFSNGPVVITKKGNLWIGRIHMQRKGGDAGRETAKMLQFKINPVELFYQ